MNKKITVIGGGTGLSVILRGLKHLEHVDLRAIVTVADDGGSTGRLRQQYQIPAMGDMRKILLALSTEEGLFNSLMDFRFDGNEDVGGHSLGNLILTAMAQITGSFGEAVSALCKVMNVKGEIIPATGELVALYALMDDGVIVKGEHNIPEYHHHIQEVFYDHEVKASERAMDVIEDADLIVFGLGSLYTSILPNLVIPEIREAIKKSKAKKVYICNAMSQGGETDAYGVEDHVEAIHAHMDGDVVDVVIVNTTQIPEQTLENYAKEGSFIVELKQYEHQYQVILEELLDLSQPLVRHDEAKLANLIDDLLKVSCM